METANETQLLIDQKISQLEQSIRLLKNDRNQQARIAQLPPEVLGRVFAEAAAVVQASGTPVAPARRFNFSFVSQRWRAVAISTPEVWGILPLGHLDWCRVMLERSRTTALTLETKLADFHSPQAKFVKQVLMDHSVRLYELRITSTYFYDLDPTQHFLDAFPASAPRLHILCLTSEREMGKLPQRTFSDAQLSFLELKGHNIDWTSSMLTGLKKLKITNNTSTSTLADFLEALKRMPNLKSLDLDNSIPSNDLQPHTPVTLSCLQQLSIASNTYDGLHALQYLVVPVSTTISILCTDYKTHTEATTWLTLNVTISRFFASMTSDTGGVLPTYHTLSISGSSACMIEAWNNPWTYTLSRMRRNDQPNFTLRLATTASIAKVIQAIPLTQIKTLALYTTQEARFLLGTWGGLSALETLVVDGRSGIINHLLSTLQYKKDTKKASYFRVAFPRLENLVMYNTLFCEHDQEDYISIDSLLDCLMERVERRAPIQKLSIFECFDVEDEDIKLLEEIVVNVEWDGENLELEGEDEEDMYEEDYLDYDEFDEDDNGLGYYPFGF